MKKLLVILFLLPLLWNCSGTRNLSEANIGDMPQTYVEGAAVDSLSLADLKWWQFYSDSTLVSLMRKALENNRDLLKCASRVEEMRRLYGVQQLNLLPTVGAQIAYSHETNDYNGAGVKKDPEYDLKLPITWEINLWGSLNHARKGAQAGFMASVEDYRAMRMTLISEVATTYFKLLSLENELTIVRQTLETRKESLEQARIRFEGGLTPETTYQQAKVEYATTASLVPDLELKVASMRNALTLLLGEYPHEIHERKGYIFDAGIGSRMPVGATSDLLKRRPDLRAAEQRLRAAMAQVGVSYADRFPSLRLGFTPGFENESLKNFFKSPFTYIIGSITGTVLDFGRKKRKYQASIAAYDQSRYAYEQAVIAAFTEVNTAITAFQKYRENTRVQQELMAAAREYVRLARLQYMGGSLNYIDVLDAQRRYFSAQIGVNNALLDEYLALINLYRSLGGGTD